MNASLILSIATGLTVSTIGPAAADQDVGAWRWYVSNALRVQHNASIPRLERSVLQTDRSFVQSYERYSPEGVPMVTIDLVKR